MAAIAKNYAELLDGMQDIHEENYAAFYTPFGAGGNLAPADVRDLVLEASNSYPKVFVKATAVGTGVRITCLLRPTRYRAPLGVNSPHAGNLYCLNGDLSSQGLPSLAIWPPQAFVRCPITTIVTVDEMEDLLEAAPGMNSLPPYADGDENTEPGQCRFLCPLPAKYAALALKQSSYSPSDFWHLIIQKVIDDGNAMSCRELLLWARLAFHQRAANDGTLYTANVSDALTAPVPDADVLDHVSGWLQADLPNRSTQANAVAVQQQLLAQQQILATIVGRQPAGGRNGVSSAQTQDSGRSLSRLPGDVVEVLWSGGRIHLATPLQPNGQLQEVGASGTRPVPLVHTRRSGWMGTSYCQSRAGAGHLLHEVHLS
jgi:hypothetical protein